MPSCLLYFFSLIASWMQRLRLAFRSISSSSCVIFLPIVFLPPAALSSAYMEHTTWLARVKRAMTHTFDFKGIPTSLAHLRHPLSPNLGKKKYSHPIGVLAFEVSIIMSKLFNLWQSLSDENVGRLRSISISLVGVRKIVSNDESFLQGLACAEMLETVHLISKSVGTYGQRCANAEYRNFGRIFTEFAESGRDPYNWVLTWKEMEAKNKTMDKYVSSTCALYKVMDELNSAESALLRSLNGAGGRLLNKEQAKHADLHLKVGWLKQDVKSLKEKSLWNKSYDTVVSLLARSVFTVLARIKLVFGLRRHLTPSYLPRSLSASTAVFPTDHNPNYTFICSALKSRLNIDHRISKLGFFETTSRLLKPPDTTLGAIGLAFHYANVIIVLEKMIRSPQLVGLEARDDLYAMLPCSIRSSLKRRLKGVGSTFTEPGLAGEWKEAVGRILGWLSPLANNMIKWQSERSFEQSNVSSRGSNVLLLQTLFFANSEKTEAAITELLVGLNYIWRFEREMMAKIALTSTFHGLRG